ncbi:cell division protein SepF [Thermobrachium celere]|uniref:cell division protein SepF n=1 Tax=Thermobrachium celere TaxID=53422 RepID=UPI0019433F77|nr:cell division protein SepF [Thermobrachium celere]GFR35029.1 hypothetical protein TCEA9_08410 [Thermobrachium celere]
MSKMLNKIFGTIGLVDEEQMEEKEVELQEQEEEEQFEMVKETKGKIVSIKSKTIAPKIVVKNPQTLGEDMEDLIDALKVKNIVIMNIADAEKKYCKKIARCSFRCSLCT